MNHQRHVIREAIVALLAGGKLHPDVARMRGAELVRAAEAQDALRRQEADELAKSKLDPATEALLATPAAEGQMPGQQKLPGMS